MLEEESLDCQKAPHGLLRLLDNLVNFEGCSVELAVGGLYGVDVEAGLVEADEGVGGVAHAGLDVEGDIHGLDELLESLLLLL